MHFVTDHFFDFITDFFGFFYIAYNRSTYFFELHLLFFFFFSFVMCFFATFLILVNNPIYSVISLILVYLCASFILVSFEVHFLAVLFILVYLGAVVVLFLFIVMMLNVKILNSVNFITFLPFLLIVITLLSFFPSFNFWLKSSIFFFSIVDFTDISMMDFFSYSSFSSLFFDIFLLESLNYQFERFSILAFLLYSHFFVELLLAAYVLLLAMIGCIALSLGKESNLLKKQDSMSQILHTNSFFLKKKVF